MLAVEDVRYNTELCQLIVGFLKNYKDVSRVRCCCRAWRCGLLVQTHPSTKHFYESCRAPFNRHFSSISMASMSSSSLISLELAGADNVNDQVLYEVGKSSPNLEVLDVSRCRKITDQGLVFIGEGCCTKLKSIDFSLIPSLTDVGISHLARRNPHLEWIAIRQDAGIGDIGAQVIIQHCRQLKSFHANNSSVTYKVVENLSQCCKHLKELTLAFCGNLSDLHLQVLSNGCRELEVIDLEHSVDITDHGYCNHITNIYNEEATIAFLFL
jgi:hypothetical protein